jgi:hypothetical protein
VAFEARAQIDMHDRSRGLSVETTVKKSKGRNSARTKVARAVLKNAGDIALIGASFIALIDSKLEKLDNNGRIQMGPRTPTNVRSKICGDLKQGGEAFFGAASEFSAKKIAERRLLTSPTESLSGGPRTTCGFVTNILNGPIWRWRRSGLACRCRRSAIRVYLWRDGRRKAGRRCDQGLAKRR